MICSKCWIDKPLDCYNKRNTKLWYRKDCKDCRKKVWHNYYINNKDTLSEKHNIYYINNKDCINQYNNDKWEDYYQNNKAKILKYHSEYRDNNREICRERCRKWKSTERWKEICIIKEWRRRSNKKSSSDWTVTIEATQELFDSQWWVCKYCGLDLIANKKHLDHIIPLSKWWPHSIYNLQRLCVQCNLRKSNKII